MSLTQFPTEKRGKKSAATQGELEEARKKPAVPAWRKHWINVRRWLTSHLSKALAAPFAVEETVSRRHERNSHTIQLRREELSLETKALPSHI